MVPLFGLCASFEKNARTARWRDLIFAACRDEDMNDQQLAGALDVPHSAVANMRAEREAGPGVLRFGNLSDSWFEKLADRINEVLGRRSVTEAQINALSKRIDDVQSQILILQALQLGKAKPVKATLPAPPAVRKRA